MIDLTLEAARTVVDTTLREARNRNLKPLAVVVYDARGALKAVAVEDGTSLRRAEIASGKANGALAMGLGSRAIHARAEQQPYFVAAVTHLPSFLRAIWNPDEGFLATEAGQLAHGGLLYQTVVDRKPPLVPWLYEGALDLFGNGSLWPLRVAAVLAHVATAALVASVARRRWGDTAGVVAGLGCVLVSIGLAPEDSQAASFETFMLPWTGGELRHYPWSALPALAGNLIAVIFVTASTTLFNTTGIEVALHREANLERELSTAGIANLLAGALGGYTGCISVSRTILNFNSGGSGRLSGLTAAAISALMLVFAPALLGFMPKFVLGGLLIYLGADQLHKWIVQSRRRLSPSEYLSLLAIILIILQWGFVAGILIGIIIGCATFALSASRIDAVKYGFDGSEYRSTLDRSRDDQALLAAHGHAIRGLNLQSYLFFGSANRLYQHVKALLQRHPDCRFLVFDFKLVTGIDSSAAYSFAQIKRTAHDRGVKLVLTHLPAAVEKTLRSSEFISREVGIVSELDHALEWCENEVIAQHQGLAQEEVCLHDWFVRLLGSEDDAAELMRRCQRLEVAAGDIIVRAGEDADSMHFILDGRVGIMVPAEGGLTTRVRSLGRYTTIGEMGLVSRAPRSATIQAEVASVLYVLTAEQFEAIMSGDPALGRKLLIYFVSVMAERLSFANRTIAVLRR